MVDQILDVYKGLGADLAITNCNSTVTNPKLPVADTFVLHKSDTVTYPSVDLDYTKRGEPVDVTADVQRPVTEV